MFLWEQWYTQVYAFGRALQVTVGISELCPYMSVSIHMKQISAI
jgi:hypothetical protein